MQDFENNSWLEVAIKVVREVLKMRIISSDNDQLAVVFYGTVRQCSLQFGLGCLLLTVNTNSPLCMQKASQNANAFDSVYTFQDLDFPDAHRIRGLEQLLGKLTIISCWFVSSISSAAFALDV